MSRARRARAIASAAAVGGAGLVGAGGAIYGVLLGQSRLARHRIGEPHDHSSGSRRDLRKSAASSSTSSSSATPVPPASG